MCHFATRLCKVIGLVLLFSSLHYGASLGTVVGKVKGPDGSPLKLAFVQAKNEQTKITISVLTDIQGAYRIENVASGNYDIRVIAKGYNSEPKSNVRVDGSPSISFDFALQKRPVRWTEVSIHQAEALLPEGSGKKELFSVCMNCHGIQNKIAISRLDENGWRNAVGLMQDFRGGVGDLWITDDYAAKIIPYLTKNFGIDSAAPAPSDIPGYEKVSNFEFGDEASKIVYVDYQMPGPDRIPWVAIPNPDKAGNVWFAESWTANGIGKLNPNTGEITEYKVPPVPNVRSLHVHHVAEGPDGMIWFAESRRCRLNKFDPKPQKFTTYPWPSCQQAKSSFSGTGDMVGSTHLAVDRYGNVWANGNALRRFDPKTEKIIEFPEGSFAYSFAFDKQQGNLWFAQLGEGKIGMIDIKTLELRRWTPPATVKLAEINRDQPPEFVETQVNPKTSGPRRIALDSEGNVWFGEWFAGQIGRFDPKTETFREFPLPDPDPTPYGLGVDRYGYVWYSSFNDDVIGRLDPKTGKVAIYPFPYAGNGVRTLTPDTDGRMWFGSPFNNKIGYFIPPKD